MLLVEQALPHPPQLLMSVLVAVVQPTVAIVPEQFANPVVQV
jgi:hypothetical protein